MVKNNIINGCKKLMAGICATAAIAAMGILMDNN